MAQASIYRGLGLIHLGELEEASVHLLQPLAPMTRRSTPGGWTCWA
jgi:hypothetical protein